MLKTKTMLTSRRRQHNYKQKSTNGDSTLERILKASKMKLDPEEISGKNRLQLKDQNSISKILLRLSGLPQLRAERSKKGENSKISTQKLLPRPNSTTEFQARTIQKKVNQSKEHMTQNVLQMVTLLTRNRKINVKKNDSQELVR